MLRERVSTDAMMAHLGDFQEIADANDGDRASAHPAMRPASGLRR